MRDVDDDVIARLKRRASRRGHSLEQELREILTVASQTPHAEMVATIDRIRAMTPRRPQTDSTQPIREDRDSR